MEKFTSYMQYYNLLTDHKNAILISCGIYRRCIVRRRRSLLCIRIVVRDWQVVTPAVKTRCRSRRTLTCSHNLEEIQPAICQQPWRWYQVLATVHDTDHSGSSSSRNTMRMKEKSPMKTGCGPTNNVAADRRRRRWKRTTNWTARNSITASTLLVKLSHFVLRFDSYTGLVQYMSQRIVNITERHSMFFAIFHNYLTLSTHGMI